MKKILTIALAAVVMAACGESGLEERASVNDNAGAEALLQVRTRTGDETTVSYPVQVYVFQSDECRAVQTIGDAGQALNIALTEGTYSVYAVGGAGSEDYDLPAKGEAATTTALTLKEGKALTDLMAASATATLTDGGTNTVTEGRGRPGEAPLRSVTTVAHRKAAVLRVTAGMTRRAVCIFCRRAASRRAWG